MISSLFSLQGLTKLKNLILFFILMSVCTVNAFAQGDLLINPKRIIFDGSKRIEEINLVNTGKDTARYAVSFIQFRMKTDGSFERITKPDSAQSFADSYLRTFPRTVTLAPNEAQVVKVQLNKVNSLQPGEYRSHLYFRAVTEDRPLDNKVAKSDLTGVSVNLAAVFGISIPVIIRSGESSTKVTLSDLRLEKKAGDKPYLYARFNRTGNMSVYGDLTIEHISKEGKKTRIGSMKGLSVYTPNATREISIKLDSQRDVDYASGKLLITFDSSKEAKPENLASAELLLH